VIETSKKDGDYTEKDGDYTEKGLCLQQCYSEVP
jgi:hypothetical protein